MKKSNLTISNALTMARLLLAPFIFYNVLISETWTALLLFVAALATDAFDGYFARTRNEVTKFGKIVDPFSDKILYASVLYGALFKNGLVFWMYFFGVLILGYIIVYSFFVIKGMKVSSKGRIATFLEAFIMLALIFGYVNDWILALFLVILAIPAYSYLIKLYKK